MAERTPADVRAKVETVLKSVIDSELARATSPIAHVADAPFSRGIIFSRTNPFSRGIFFSRVAGDDTFLERPALEGEVAMDPVILGALAERLTQLRSVKDLKGEFRVNSAPSSKTSIDRAE